MRSKINYLRDSDSQCIWVLIFCVPPVWLSFLWLSPPKTNICIECHNVPVFNHFIQKYRHYNLRSTDFLQERIFIISFLASTKTATIAAKTAKTACKKGLLTLHYEADLRDGNGGRDIEWKIKFPGTDVWIKFFTCTIKPGPVCHCKIDQTVLADGFTLLNNSNCDYSHNVTVTIAIERSGNAAHDYAEIMYQVHYFNPSVSPSTQIYQVNFTAQCKFN